MLYNVPSRTGVNLLASTTLRLAEIDNIVGVNQAVGESGQVTQQVMSAAGTLAAHSDSLRKEVDKFLQTVRAA